MAQKKRDKEESKSRGDEENPDDEPEVGDGTEEDESKAAASAVSPTKSKRTGRFFSESNSRLDDTMGRKGDASPTNVTHGSIRIIKQGSEQGVEVSAITRKETGSESHDKEESAISRLTTEKSVTHVGKIRRVASKRDPKKKPAPKAKDSDEDTNDSILDKEDEPEDDGDAGDAKEEKKVDVEDYTGDDGTSLRYTRITDASPPVYQEGKHKLRYCLKRKPRIFLVITMYNEGRDELEGTLKGVGENIKFMIEKIGDKDFWQELVLCIVSDGRTKANGDTLDYMTEIGICNPKDMTDNLVIPGKEPPSCHLFESTIQLKDNDTDNEFLPPMQMMVAIKENNKGKLDSHWWFYTAFSSVMNPDYTFLLDVGTTPAYKSFYYMFKALERDKNVAGVAGEITTASAINLLNPLVAAQQFEYKISCILDKTTESMFGYISVLPGAFSAYRWDALQGEPLKKYFHHLSTPLKKQRPFQSNMYLAEDRILCYELVGKKDHKYTLQYVVEAVATTDVPTKLPALIKQRRRWLNGSLFALLYAMFGWKSILTNTTHSPIRKFFLTIQFLYYILTVMLQWTSVANIYLTFYFLVSQMDDGALFNALRLIFLGTLVIQLVLGLGNKPDRVGAVYNIVSIILGLFMLGILAVSIYQVTTLQTITFQIWGSVAASFGSIFLVAFLYGSLGEILFSFVQYIYFSSTYIVIFSLYSLCNTHDISWGTKNLDDNKFAEKAAMIIGGGQEGDSEKVKAKLRHMQKLQQEEKSIRDKIAAKFEAFRSYLLLIWILTNGLYASVLTSFNSDGVRTWYLTIVFGLVFVMSTMRMIGALMYLSLNFIYNCIPFKVPKDPPTIYVTE